MFMFRPLLITLILGAATLLSGSEQERALFKAVKNRNFEHIEKLLEQGINVNAQDEQGRTALMIAAANTDILSVFALLKYKPDVTLRDKNKWTALMYTEKALSENELKAHYAYYDNDYNDNSYEQGLCRNSRLIIKLLKEHGATE